ncbi:hypothetical protein SRDD_29130 [Serratia sp. DD3]|nr:hypothetical protein SRDD_29130 [Serratia sp. DD3]
MLQRNMKAIHSCCLGVNESYQTHLSDNDANR